MVYGNLNAADVQICGNTINNTHIFPLNFFVTLSKFKNIFSSSDWEDDRVGCKFLRDVPDQSANEAT